MIKINLLPVREKVKKENIRRQITIGALLVVFSMAVMAYYYLQISHQLGAVRTEKAQMEKQLADLKKEVGDLSKIKGQKEALEKRKSAIASLDRNRVGLVRVMDELSSAKPSALYFTSLEQKVTGAPWDDFGIVLTGIATDNEIIAEFMRNLQKIPIFKAVDLDYTKSKPMQKEGGVFQEFRLNLQVSFAEKKPAQPATPPPKPKG